MSLGATVFVMQKAKKLENGGRCSSPFDSILGKLQPCSIFLSYTSVKCPFNSRQRITIALLPILI